MLARPPSQSDSWPLSQPLHRLFETDQEAVCSVGREAYWSVTHPPVHQSIHPSTHPPQLLSTAPAVSTQAAELPVSGAWWEEGHPGEGEGQVQAGLETAWVRNLRRRDEVMERWVAREGLSEEVTC